MTDEIEAIAALADPVRRRLYELVAAAGEPVGREEAAAGAGVPAHSARFHLDRLVEDGLLEVEYRRLTGRSGPGAGRPAKLYRRSAREVAVSVPPRSYDLVGAILADAVARSLHGGELARSLANAAHSRGRAVAVAGPHAAAPGDDLERTAAVLAGEGFEPAMVEGELCLRNCPFDALAREHTALVCGVNLDFVGGVVDGLGCRAATPRLDPHEDRCCVVVAET
jgi:predicted ArsR family transcriptional regulator